ncbi:MAG: hypothetical protein H7A45_21110 [Verrucomicrobiales bacterium]|nr:hypothetical protein [Verrucomicrobiales bacterium]
MKQSQFLIQGLAAVAVTCGTARALSATLTMVPMQGGMVMPMVSYRSVDSRLHVMVPGEAPQLTPLLVSHPGDAFDPVDPWYDALDPARGGLSFSRRYGFVMDATTEPLPADSAMWIRRLEGSPELGFYRYSASDPKAWEPIFGTDGSPTAWQWNGMMFHPGVTAMPGAESLSATFEVYLANATTGEELPGTGTGPMLLNWTNVSDGRPVLGIAMRVVIDWPEDGQSYVLESADALPSANWTTVATEPVRIGDRPSVVLEAAAATRFFRLRPVP